MNSTDHASDRAPDQLNMNLYLAPEQLTANEANDKARPAERPEQRKARIERMAESLRSNGQELPVLVVEVETDGVTTYEYVDGGCRVEAMAALNDKDSGARTVWCSIVDPAEDLFKKAVTANLHRTQNSLLDMAYIVTEVRERNGWKGKGGGTKVAEYLGIQPSRVTEYEKILRATGTAKAKIESGEIASVDAALKLMAEPEEKQERVAERAREIADAEEKAKPESKRKVKAPLTAEQKSTFQSVKDSAKRDKERKDDDAADQDSTPKVAATSVAPAAVTIKAKHIMEAAREVSGKSSPRSKSEIADFFGAVSAAAYPEAAVKFCEYFVDKWMAGDGTDRHARDLFDAAVRSSKSKTKAVKVVAKPAKSVAKQVAKPVAKPIAKPTAKSAAKTAKPKAKGKK